MLLICTLTQPNSPQFRRPCGVVTQQDVRRWSDVRLYPGKAQCIVALLRSVSSSLLCFEGLLPVTGHMFKNLYWRVLYKPGVCLKPVIDGGSVFKLIGAIKNGYSQYLCRRHTCQF